MVPQIIPLLLLIVPEVVAVVKKYGGIPGLLATERRTVVAIRKVAADWRAARASDSAGGKVITLDEARVIAADMVSALEMALGPLLAVPEGMDATAFAEELAVKVLPGLFRWLTGQEWAAVAPQLGIALAA